MAAKTLVVKLTKSPIGRMAKHRACLRGLGLRRIGQAVELEDTPSVRGMIKRIDYMVEIEGEA
ncbi:MAG: 50S ribosomal protein L30 [Gammaproteobacteria bacterium]|nr:50S ribosomal protein L30 [Gammaproteobacteria bacterium]